jgi:hypothetical protein
MLSLRVTLHLSPTVCAAVAMEMAGLAWSPNGTMTNGAVRSLGADYVERLGAVVAAMDDEHVYFGGGAAAR